MATADHDFSAARADPIRLPSKKRRPSLDFALPAVAIGSGTMLCLAMPSLIDATSTWDYAKVVTLAFSATAVSFGVNKLAVERGAELGTTGYVGATIVSIGSILAVGGGLFAATYAGLTLKDTEDLQLREHGQALSAYVSARSVAASSAARINPAIRATESDLREKANCETETSCISGHRNGGNGVVARIVQGYAGRAASITQQVTDGETVRQRIMGRLNADIVAYQAILNDAALTIDERRAKLQAADARLRQGVGELDAVVPLSLVAAYANELQSGFSIPDRPEAEARLNSILSRHGKSLEAVTDDIKEIKVIPPSFPGRPGVSDTFGYVLHFLPIAAIAFVVELVFPLVLWALTYWQLAWRKHKEAPPSNGDDRSLASSAAPTRPELQIPSLAAQPIEPARRGRPPAALRDRDLRLQNGDDRRSDR